MTRLLYLFALIGLYGCPTNDTIQILPLHPYTKVEPFLDTSESKAFYFYVKHFDFNKKILYDSLVRFAVHTRLSDVDTSNFQSYTVNFFSHSGSTNENYRESPSDLIYWHNNDLLLTMNWIRGLPPTILRYKNGKSIEKFDVEMSEITADTTAIN